MMGDLMGCSKAWGGGCWWWSGW